LLNRKAICHPVNRPGGRSNDNHKNRFGASQRVSGLLHTPIGNGKRG
jgi:hypothetical protein